MKSLAIVVRGFGFNSDLELARAFELSGARAERVQLSDLIEKPEILRDARFLGFPGGFSFGDHLGSGAVVANLCRSRLKPAIASFVSGGGMAIGICNGFQAMARMGILPGFTEDWERLVGLAPNASGLFVDRWVKVAFEPGSRCLWTAGLPPMSLPIRHGEGRFACASAEVLARLEGEGMVALRYSGENPNGSEAGIAGICDPSGRVLGLMPHPEAFLVEENHPLRRRGFSGGTGLQLFAKAVTAAGA